jgi:autotransporter-associated beta strand protein
MKAKSTLCSFLALAGSSLLAVSYTHAANIWDGGGGNGNWNTADNWDNDLLPGTGALTFTGDVQTSTNNDLVAVNPSFGGINFTNDGSAGKTSAFTLAGSQITLGGGITTTANTTGSTITDLISLDMILSGNRTITTNQLSGSVQHNLEISGVISQNASGRQLIKAGAGTLTLSGSGSNSYTGTTTAQAGLLNLAKSGSATAVAGALTIGLNDVRNNDPTVTVKLTGASSNQIADTSAVTIYGRGTLDFNGKDETIGNVTINGARARNVDPTHIINSGTGGNLTIGTLGITAWSGFNSRIDSGSGTLTLGGNVTFTASPNVSYIVGGNTNPTGQAQISGNLALGATRTFSVAAGTGTGHDLLVDAAISGSGFGITKTGLGRLVLGGSNTYTGLTTVSGGKLIATHGSALGGGGGLTVDDDRSFIYAPTAAGALDLGAGALTLGNFLEFGTTTSIGTALGGTAGQSAITSSSAAALYGTGVVNIQAIPGATLTAGTNNLITAASGLDGGSYTLGTVYNNTNYTVSNFTRTGTAISVDVASETALSGNVNWKGGLANVAGNTGVWAASNGSTQSNWQVTDGVNQPLAPGAAADLVFDSTVISSPGTMAGMSLGANMTVRSLTINDTTTAFGLLGDGNALTITPASSTTGLTIGTDVQASTLAANVVLGADQTWTNHSANTLTVTGVISGSGNLTKAGTGRVDLKGENTFNGGITLSGGTLGISWHTANLNDFTVTENATATLDASIDTRFDGNSRYNPAEKGAIAINSGANLTLKGGNSYKVLGALTGNGTLNLEGRAEFLNASNTFTGAINLTATTVQSNFIGSSLADATSLGSGDITLQPTGTSSANFSIDNGVVGDITFTNRRFVLAGGAATGTSSITHGTNSTLTIASNIINNSTAAKELRLGGNVGPGSGTISGTITDSTNAGEALTVKKIGTGTWNLTNSSNSYTGGTLVGDGSSSNTVLGFANGALGTTGDVLIYRSTLRWLAGNTQDISARLVMGHAFTTTLDTNGNDVTFANGIGTNPLGNTGSFAKEGLGTLTLQGTNTYTGNTTVRAGTLIVNGNNSTSLLTTVQTGATLGGTGTVGALTIDAGGVFSPGNSPGIQTVNGNYIQNGTLQVEIEGDTAGNGTGFHDQVVVNGTVTLGLDSELSLTTFSGTYAPNALIFILLNDGEDAIAGTFTGLAQGAVVGNYDSKDWQISYTANSSSNSFTGGNDIALMAIPEPRAALLGGLGLLMLLRRRRE